MRPTLVSIPENQTLNEKPKKTPRKKTHRRSIQHTEFDYIMMNGVPKNSNHINRDDTSEINMEISNALKELIHNKKQIFHIMNEVFETLSSEFSNNVKETITTSPVIKSNEVMENIKYCFLNIHQYIENEKKHMICYDTSSNKLDKLITNELTKPKQQTIDKILEIKRKYVETNVDPYGILYRNMENKKTTKREKEKEN